MPDVMPDVAATAATPAAPLCPGCGREPGFDRLDGLCGRCYCYGPPPAPAPRCRACQTRPAQPQAKYEGRCYPCHRAAIDAGKPRCRRCHEGRVSRPRGLCWNCYYRSGEREQYPVEKPKYLPRPESNLRYPPRLPAEPTSAPAGSEAKILVMIERAGRRESLFHPADGPK
ncbi:MAG TPA: hypothetical protein VFW33_08655 [Gemmataceae bacterium]|nr:hypothetical protein [Gemmataceae bacterium]